MHATTDDLRAALEAALPDLTEDQARAARDLLATLAPPMEEPTWPGAPVIAMCGNGRIRLHVRRSDGPNSGWECALYCTSIEWSKLTNPRPLTPAEYAEHGIPAPCEHVADEETVERATQAFREHQGDVPESMRAGLIAAGFKAGRTWDEYELIDPRPLTAEERAKYGIPSECYKPHAGPITDELVERAAEAIWNVLGTYAPWSEVEAIRKSHYQNYARAALAAALREAGE